MNSREVARYLQEHPEFFEEYADQMAQIYVPHPHGGRAIPISERQILTLREKNRLLEAKLQELISFGEENDAIGEKMHRLTLALVSARNLEELLYALNFNLKEDFAVPHVALRIWNDAASALPELSPVSPDLHAMAESLNHPYCGGHVAEEARAWFGEAAPRLRSFALVPLRQRATLGLLALASEDPKRFYPEMGTLYLKRLGELCGAALTRCLE